MSAGGRVRGRARDRSREAPRGICWGAVGLRLAAGTRLSRVVSLWPPPTLRSSSSHRPPRTGASDPDDALVSAARYQTTSVYGHPLCDGTVITALLSEEPPQTDGREGLHSLELLVAIYLSARDARRVGLPLEY